MSITRALIFLDDEQKIRAEKILSAAKAEMVKALHEIPRR